MEENKQIQQVESKIIMLRGIQVILDRDIAELYGVETRVVNQAVKRNSERFPKGYILQLTSDEYKNLKSQSVISSWGGVRKMPYAFTEKGLYMLATILRSPIAIETSIAIIETFTKLRQLARAMQQANEEIANGGELPTDQEQGVFKSLMNEIFVDPMPIKIQKMTFGVNLGFFKWELETTREKK
ncbi:ORF6N domain-containing protein [Prevotella aurantiaca]|jgi:hypothetical protein|uniref:ORF6N domain-containing protein n=1 Tax=Prevotella aurantiaca TaxID=596085 RepID=UPI0023EF6A97